MKSKTILILLVVFSISFFSAARKNYCTCNNAVCSNLKKQKSMDKEKNSKEKETGADLPVFGNFLLNI